MLSVSVCRRVAHCDFRKKNFSCHETRSHAVHCLVQRNPDVVYILSEKHFSTKSKTQRSSERLSESERALLTHCAFVLDVGHGTNVEGGGVLPLLLLQLQLLALNYTRETELAGCAAQRMCTDNWNGAVSGMWILLLRTGQRSKNQHQFS